MEAEGRLAGPPLVVRATSTGRRPTVGTRAALPLVAEPRLGAATRPPDRVADPAAGAAFRAPAARAPFDARAPPVFGPTCGARRFTEVVPFGREETAPATAVREGAAGTAPLLRWAVRVADARPAFSLYSVPAR